MGGYSTGTQWDLSPIIALLGGLGGGLGSSIPNNLSGTGTSTTNTQGEQNTSSSSNASSTLQNLLNSIFSQSNQQQQTQTTTPNLSPATQTLLDKLIGSFSSIAKPVDMRGYQASGIQGINTGADLNRQAVDNIMASRGLATSPAAGTADANIEANRIGQINSLNSSLPLLSNQLNLANLNAAGGFFSQIPKGSTTTGSVLGTQTGTNQQTQNQTGQNYANNFGYSSNQQSQHTDQQSQQQQGGGVGRGIAGAAGGIASILAGLFSDERLKEEIKEIPSEKAVKAIMQLKPSTWKWKKDRDADTGVIAQDIEKVLPNLVHVDKDSGFKQVNYAGLTSTLVAAMQAINKKVEANA